VIEVADSSLEVDKQIKTPIYAKAGIQNYRVVDVRAKEITLCQNPAEDFYQDVKAVKGRERFLPLAFPEIPFCAEELFPKVK